MMYRYTGKKTFKIQTFFISLLVWRAGLAVGQHVLGCPPTNRAPASLLKALRLMKMFLWLFRPVD